VAAARAAQFFLFDDIVVFFVSRAGAATNVGGVTRIQVPVAVRRSGPALPSLARFIKRCAPAARRAAAEEGQRRSAFFFYPLPLLLR
jgi:hypothetical protein